MPATEQEGELDHAEHSVQDEYQCEDNGGHCRVEGVFVLAGLGGGCGRRRARVHAQPVGDFGLREDGQAEGEQEHDDEHVAHEFGDVDRTDDVAQYVVEHQVAGGQQ